MHDFVSDFAFGSLGVSVVSLDLHIILGLP